MATLKANIRMQLTFFFIYGATCEFSFERSIKTRFFRMLFW